MDQPSLQLARAAATAIWDKKGFEVLVLRVAEIAQYTDYLVLASATSDRHASAIAEHVEQELGKAGHRAIGTEGHRQGRWILVDFGDIVVHVFHRPVRAYYELERLFLDAPRVELDEPAWLAQLSPDAIEEASYGGVDLWNSVEEAMADTWDDELDDSEIDGLDRQGPSNIADKTDSCGESSHSAGQDDRGPNEP